MRYDSSLPVHTLHMQSSDEDYAARALKLGKMVICVILNFKKFRVYIYRSLASSYPKPARCPRSPL